MYLRTARIANYMTQVEMARKLGVSQTVISAWELGKDPVPKSRRPQLEGLLNLSIQFDIKQLKEK